MNDVDTTIDVSAFSRRAEVALFAATQGISIAKAVERLVNQALSVGDGRNSAGTMMVRIEGHDLVTLRNLLCSKRHGLDPYLLRVDQRSDTVAFKVNAGEWTHGMGKPQPPY